MGGPGVPQNQMSPRTCGPRTSCPPRRMVLGPNVPCQDRMSPPHQSWVQGLRTRLAAFSNAFAEDVVLQATPFTECGLLALFPGSPPHQSLGNEASRLWSHAVLIDIKLESNQPTWFRDYCTPQSCAKKIPPPPPPPPK